LKEKKMKKSLVILGLSTWTIAGCSPDFEAEELKDPQAIVSEQAETPQLEPVPQPTDFGLTALQASFDSENGELEIRYYATDKVVVGLCAKTVDGHETCVVDTQDVSHSMYLEEVVGTQYRLTMMNQNGKHRDYGPYTIPSGNAWQDVISCESHIQPNEIILEPRGKRLYIESVEELRAQVCEQGVCTEAIGVDGFEVDYLGEDASVMLQDQYGCRLEMSKKPMID